MIKPRVNKYSFKLLFFTQITYTQLFEIKCFCLIQLILDQIYLTFRCDPNRLYPSWSGWT